MRIDADRTIRTDCDIHARSKREIQIPSFTNPFKGETVITAKERQLEYSERRLLG